MTYKSFFFFTLFFIFLGCNSQGEKEEEIIEVPEVINCSNTTISVSEQDNTVIQHATNPVVWEGTYNENSVKISYTKSVGVDGETETLVFVFNKIENCLEIEHAFKFYNGNQVDVSAITKVDVSEFLTKEWVIDKKFSGVVVYVDPHDKKTYSRKFWLNFTEQDIEVENTNYLLFEDCFEAKLPMDIDMNNDDIVDYQIIFEKIRDTGNRPQFNIYTIKLISTNESENQILSPKKSQSPYTVLFEAPFTSENTRQYFNGVKNALDVFYEFDAPYKNYNFFLHNNLTYKSILENDQEDYYIIKMGLADMNYFGWIKFNFNSTTCTVEVLDTFLSTNANEDVIVK